MQRNGCGHLSSDPLNINIVPALAITMKIGSLTKEIVEISNIGSISLYFDYYFLI